MWIHRVMAASSVVLLATVTVWAQEQAPPAQAPPAQAPPAQQQRSTPRASELGLVVFPANNQPAEQQQAEESECFMWALNNTGIDPLAPVAAPPPAQKQGADGSAVRGAAKGAAAGAAVGAIAGDTGEGAAIGAVAGGVRGRKQAKQANKAANQNAQAQAAAAQQNQVATFNKAWSACLEGKGYTVK